MRSLMGLCTEEAAFTFSGRLGGAISGTILQGGQGSSGQCWQLLVGQGRKTRWQDHQHRVSAWSPEERAKWGCRHIGSRELGQGRSPEEYRVWFENSGFEYHERGHLLFCLDGKDRVQRTIQGGRPRVRSFWKRAECQSESKALEKSMVAITVQSGGLFFWKPS